MKLRLTGGSAPIDLTTSDGLSLTAGASYSLQVRTGTLCYAEHSTDPGNTSDDCLVFEESTMPRDLLSFTPDATLKPWVWTHSDECILIVEAG